MMLPTGEKFDGPVTADARRYLLSLGPRPHDLVGLLDQLEAVHDEAVRVGQTNPRDDLAEALLAFHGAGALIAGDARTVAAVDPEADR
jgi:hypothetical protein